MDLKIAAAAGLAILVGLGVEGGLHYRHQLRAFNQHEVVMMDAGNRGFGDLQLAYDRSDESEQMQSQRECIRQSLRDASSELRRNLHEQMLSTRSERKAALEHVSEMRDDIRRQMQERVRDQVREQRERLRDQQEQLREQRERMRAQISEAETRD